MSAAKEPTPLPSDKELQEALATRLHPCPICRGTDWHSGQTAIVAIPSLQDDGDEGLKVIAKGEPDSFGIKSMVALPVVCGDCGHIAFFHLDTLLGRFSEPTGE